MGKNSNPSAFESAVRTYGVRIASVREIVASRKSPPFPARGLIEGVIQPREKLFVTDLRKRLAALHSARQTESHPPREIENKLIGLIVSSASEVLKFPLPQSEAPGYVFADSESNYVREAASSRARLIILLDIARIRASRIPNSRRTVEPVRLSGNASPALPPQRDFRISNRGTIKAQISAYRGDLSCSRTLSYQDCALFFE